MGPRAFQPIPPLTIERIVRIGTNTEIVISLRDEANINRLYISNDQGKSWMTLPSEATQASTISSIYYDPDDPAELREVMSGVDAQVVYSYVGSLSNIRLSTDGGKSWKEFVPKIATTATVTGLAIIGMGMKASRRVYAMVWTTEGHGIYRSDDYGRNFRLFADRIQLVPEHRADDSMLYGLSGELLMNTVDGGKNWTAVEGTEFLHKPLYRTPERYLTTVKENQYDQEVRPRSVEQIESDPFDPAIIYLRTPRGLVRSTDYARSFTVLPLATDMLYGIVDVAVDPARRGHLYAVIGDSSLQRSLDWGCSWSEVALPPNR
jgi:hypothetical protein